ncbi:polymer-forming cytoskeletal protein [Desulfovibrio sp. TomC]|uniref:polymer-forming cytoskeletal protein n=1 Tax=Desulfovibrio sp. TomC TaxID=1562888 RepID=UPI0005757154|nr:polymer-forming cytoskeletal protein [Desulfovibrio sp. TomC]KHK00180.1 hypothetical protein NY78_4399 [Desulfovibrio sp. TomC]
MQKSLNKNSGFSLILIIVAVLAIAGLSVGMSQMSTISTLNQLEFNQANIARNLAYSGVEYAKGVAFDSQSTIKVEDLVSKLNSGGTKGSNTYNLDNNSGSFSLTAAKVSDTSFSLMVQGDTFGSSLQAKYKLLSSAIIQFTPAVVNDSDQIAMYGSGSIALNSSSTVKGSIYSASGVTINKDAKVTGNVNSNGAVILNSGAEVLNDICMKGDGTFNSDSYVGGDVRVVGNLTLNGGTVEGTLYVSGKVTIQGNATVHDVYAHEVSINSINLLGEVYSQTTIANRSGAKYHTNQTNISDKLPTGCSTPTLVPEDANFTSNKAVLVQDQSEYTFSAKDNNDSYYHSIDLSSFTLNNKNKTLKFDLSSGDINILVTGDVTFNKNFSIIVSEDGKTWSDPFDPANITDKMKRYAKRIYLESHGTVSFNEGSSWVGTVYAHSINLNEGTNILGAVYSKSTQQNANKNTVITLVSSNFANTWWIPPEK